MRIHHVRDKQINGLEICLSNNFAATFRRKWPISGKLRSPEESGGGGKKGGIGSLVSGGGQSLTLSELASAFG